MKKANGARSNAIPSVNARLELPEERDDTSVANPAAIISRPKRLSGLRYHANSPQRTYGRISQARSEICSAGSGPAWSLASCSRIVPAVPAIAIAAIPATAMGLGRFTGTGSFIHARPGVAKFSPSVAETLAFDDPTPGHRALRAVSKRMSTTRRSRSERAWRPDQRSIALHGERLLIGAFPLADGGGGIRTLGGP